MTDWLAEAPWMLLAIALPLLGALLAFLRPHRAAMIGLIGAFMSAGAALAVLLQVVFGGPRQYEVGGWGAPLGINLWADGLSAMMLAMTAGSKVVVESK